MNYNIGDTVLYGTDGVCRIAEFSEQKIGKETLSYYILKPIYDEKATIYVPAQNEKLLGKMKSILTEDEICGAIEEACKAKEDWTFDDAKRGEKFRKIVDSGDIAQITKLIRMIYRRRAEVTLRGKKLRVSDERTLKECEKILFDEFALVLGMKRNQVQQFLMDKFGIGA